MSSFPVKLLAVIAICVLVGVSSAPLPFGGEKESSLHVSNCRDGSRKMTTEKEVECTEKVYVIFSASIINSPGFMVLLGLIRPAPTAKGFWILILLLFDATTRNLALERGTDYDIGLDGIASGPIRETG
ncbi:hypothetical protein FNV43_RR20262 [Rhamnella rubrinervis]|uniref:Uncharacterized protein n=1 Tax=Rhamnella rubrinervis TaxID=2594499 RepID=A0A8K0E016_9ROSA|nr:hypothetical protein FNV43_RR20262 [Rhamnella rubrinervis]